MDAWSWPSYVGLPKNCHKVEGIQLSYTITLWFPFTGPNGPSPNMFQHDNASKNKASVVKTYFSKVGMEEFEWPAQSTDFNPTCDMESNTNCAPRLLARHHHPTSLMVLLLNHQSDTQKSNGKPSQKIESYSSSTGGARSILLQCLWNWMFNKHIWVSYHMSRCPYTFDHIV